MSTIQMIEFPSNGHNTPGYLAQPDGDGAYPGIVVIQEWWGLNPHIKEVAERFATAGYVALAPDLYYGEVATEPDEARKLAMALDRERAIAKVLAAAQYLQGMKSVSSQKMGVVGWCMGGALSLSSAADSVDELGATVAFYGRPLSAEDTPKLEVPVLGLYGEKDAGIPVTAVREFEKELQANGKTHQIHVYDEAPHAFFNDTRPSYRSEAAQDAWQKTLGWFEKYVA